MSSLYVAGIGFHPFGRFPEKGLKDLAATAIHEAVRDAGLSVQDIEAAWVANAYGGLLTGQESVRGQVVLSYAGLSGIPITNVENACAGGSTGIHAASLALRAGEYDVALIVGVEKMFVGDTARTVKAIASSSDVDVLGGTGFQFVGGYAIRARQYMKSYGATPDDLGYVVRKNRSNAALNPNAQFQSSVTLEQVLESRPICEPLTLFMCSSISDGAAAIVLVSQRKAEQLGSRSRVRLEACRLRSGEVNGHSGDNHGSVHITALEAFEHASIGPEDLDLLEVHDAAAPAEWDHLEDLGICNRGESYQRIRNGEMDLDGQIPVNPSGGLLGRGHPVAATGLAQIAEVVTQLRGEAANRAIRGPHESPRTGLCLNTGGRIGDDKAAVAVHILTI